MTTELLENAMKRFPVGARVRPGIRRDAIAGLVVGYKTFTVGTTPCINVEVLTRYGIRLYATAVLTMIGPNE